MNPYIRLSFAALLPVFAAAILAFVEKKDFWKRLPYAVKQILIGILFGSLAVYGTERGVDIGTAVINTRDASVLIGGLLFGGPAGIIAGVIGGVERWIAVAWGVGSYTRIACSVATVCAGFIGALARRYFFENGRPKWGVSFTIGFVTEIFHLSMVFLTHMDDPAKAMSVVRVCTVPMVLANSLPVLLAALVIYLPAFTRKKEKQKPSISQTVERHLLIVVVVAFLLTSLFVFSLQNTLASAQTKSLLSISAESVADDIGDFSDENLLEKARKIAGAVDTLTLNAIIKRYEVDEINLVGPDGIIFESSDPNLVGFDMNSGEQAREFLALLDDKKEMVQSYGPITYDSSRYRKYAGVRTKDGFVQIGYGSETFQKELQYQVDGITQNRHVGGTGCVLIFNEELELVSAPKDFALTVDPSALRSEAPASVITMKLGDEDAYGYFLKNEGYYILSLLPEEEANQSRNIAVYVNCYLEVLAFAILFVMLYMLIRFVVSEKLAKINGSLAKITAGDLDEVVDVRNNREFEALSDDINSTVGTLKNYIAEASARIDRELQFAKDIQSSALPSVFPAFPKRSDFDIYATMHPAKEVGGDFYDFYMIDDKTLHFLIADVSGKGIPAALFMMRAKTELKSMTENGLEIGDAFTKSNAALYEGNDAGMFVTAWQGGIELRHGIVHYANAGHNPPLIRKKGGKFEYLRSPAGFVLAGMDSVKYRSKELKMEPGDIIYLYTDGVTEAQNAAGELFGEDRLLASLNALPEEVDMQTVCAHVKEDVDAFVSGAPQFDDITMVAMHYIGTPTLTVDASASDALGSVTGFLKEELAKLLVPAGATEEILASVSDIYPQIVKYAYPEKDGNIRVMIFPKERETGTPAVCIRFEDDGTPYNPLICEAEKDRTGTENGVCFVKGNMDDIRYKYENNSNILTVVKRTN